MFKFKHEMTIVFIVTIVMMAGCGSTGGNSQIGEFRKLERTADAVLLSNACPKTADAERTKSEYGADLIPNNRGGHNVEVSASTRVLCGIGRIPAVQQPRIEQ